MLDKTPRGGKKKGKKHSCHEGREKNGDSLNRYRLGNFSEKLLKMRMAT